jgi:hypothetical protein
MRTRNRLLPVLLLILAISTPAFITVPIAKARMAPPTQVVIVDPGDPDDPAGDYKSAILPPSGEPTRPVDCTSQTCAPRASVPDAGTTALATLHMDKWQLRDILLYLLFQSPVLR